MPTSRRSRRCSASRAAGASISSVISGYSCDSPVRTTRPRPCSGFGRCGLVRAQALGERELVRVAVGRHDLLAHSVVVDEVDGAPVGDLRDRRPGDVAQRLGVVHRGAERAAGLGEEAAAQLRRLDRRDVLDDRRGRDDLAGLVAQRRGLEEVPAQRAAAAIDGAHEQRLGVLAAQQAHGRDVVHRQRAGRPRARRCSRCHDRARGPRLQLRQRAEAHVLQRRPVGVDDVVGAVADRDRPRRARRGSPRSRARGRASRPRAAPAGRRARRGPARARERASRSSASCAQTVSRTGTSLPSRRQRVSSSGPVEDAALAGRRGSARRPVAMRRAVLGRDERVGDVTPSASSFA